LHHGISTAAALRSAKGSQEPTDSSLWTEETVIKNSEKKKTVMSAFLDYREERDVLTGEKHEIFTAKSYR